MNKIDAHQHFWHFDPKKDSWITPDMAVIQKDFLPDDLLPVLQQHKVDGCVAVQASQTLAETDFLIQLASEHDFIQAVVGWIDLKAPADELTEQLIHYRQFPKLKGFRHILQGEQLNEFLRDGSFSAGLTQLGDFGYSYDLLAFHPQLPFIIQLVKQHPEQRFVLDHLGKPDIKTGELSEWKRNITALAALPNVFCKLSGLVTEGDWNNWTEDQVTDCLDICVDAFGTDRLLFGSDWPVCLLATTYGGWLDLLVQYFGAFSADEQSKVFGGNTATFYQI